MLKIGVIGASGMAGSAIFTEAESAGLEVTAIVRNVEKAKQVLGVDAKILGKDAFTLTKSDLIRFDVVVDAFSTIPSMSYLHIDLATKLVSLLRGIQVPRLIFILGAASLYVGQGNNRHRLLDDLMGDPAAEGWIDQPKSQVAELEFLESVTNVNWTGISPGKNFFSGEAAKIIIEGKDNLLTNDYGRSETTSFTLAKTLVKEVKQPKHLGERFTVING